RAPQRNALDEDGEVVVAALIPIVLQGALPDDSAQRQAALVETLQGVDKAIAGLPPHAQTELARLFTLLALAPTRVALLHTTRGWQELDGDTVQAFLERLRTSNSHLLRSAYDAIHQLVLAAWYGNPRAWAGIGYDGPPALS
ncbi:MAG TPA: hypothetical protein VMV45_01315, partial [Casimicrobiaceae bacterium]|nr:hypothetical protein [Casimicrobiaceae bacterium]